jgi:hypothetical protein
MERIYWLHIVDPGPNDNFISEGENMVKKFILFGYKLYNLLIFTSNNSIKEIHEQIKTQKSKEFMYFLTDMTENIKENTLQGIVNKNYYKYSEKLVETLHSYKPLAPKTENLKARQEKMDLILDQINQKGIESLNPGQKAFLESF